MKTEHFRSRMPGFTAGASLAKPRELYKAITVGNVTEAGLPSAGIVPAYGARECYFDCRGVGLHHAFCAKACLD